MLRPEEALPLIGVGSPRRMLSLSVAVSAGLMALSLVALVGSGVMMARTELLGGVNRRIVHNRATSKLIPAEAAGLGGGSGMVRHPSLADSEEEAPEIMVPSADQITALFKDRADTVFQGLGIDPASLDAEADLVEACGDLTMPCVARVGECLNSRIVTTAEGKMTPGPTACQCFTRAMVQPMIIDEAQPEVRPRPIQPRARAHLPARRARGL